MVRDEVISHTQKTEFIKLNVQVRLTFDVILTCIAVLKKYAMIKINKDLIYISKYHT